MRVALELSALFAVTVTFALALAHALEWPGKLRLDRQQYFAVQRIYYPGFTYAGVLEPLSIALLLALVLTTSSSSVAFMILLIAFGAAVTTHLFYWLLTAPVNKVWVADAPLDGSARRLFEAAKTEGSADWKALRNRWERSHALRTVSSFIAFAALAAAITLR